MGSLVTNKLYGPNNLTASVSNTPGSPINATIDTSFFFSPPSSLHINCTAANSTTALLSENLAAPWPQIYGRSMVYFDSDATYQLPLNVHSWIFQAQGINSYYNVTPFNATVGPSGTVSMNIIVGNPHIALNYHWSNTGAEQSVTSKLSITPNNWFCLQWYYDGPGSNVMVWVNGTVYLNVTHNKSFTAYTPVDSTDWRFPDAPGWNKFQFGYQHYQTLNKSVSLHLDDFVLDTQMTCCPCPPDVNMSYCCPSGPTPAPTSAPTAADQGKNAGFAVAAPLVLLASLSLLSF